MKKKQMMSILLFPLAFIMLGVVALGFLPVGTYTNRTASEQIEWRRNQGMRLMQYAEVQEGDATLVCTNWACPTSIVVNAMRYTVSTNYWNGNLEYSITTTNFPFENIANGDITIKENEQEALLSAFVDESYTSMPLTNYVKSLSVLPVGLTTNAVFISNLGRESHFVYKSIHIRYEILQTASPATNSLVFLSAILNEGLPEEERIVLPQSQ